MGIQGLHASLRSHARAVHISSFAGKRVAVDASGWLHKSVYTCALDLGTDARPWGDGVPPYVQYCCRLPRVSGP